jgi:hypothetical protein
MQRVNEHFFFLQIYSSTKNIDLNALDNYMISILLKNCNSDRRLS